MLESDNPHACWGFRISPGDHIGPVTHHFPTQHSQFGIIATDPGELQETGAVIRVALASMDWKRFSVTFGLFAGLLAYFTTFMIYFGTIFVMPYPFVVVPPLWALWLVGAWFSVRLARRRSLWVLASGPAVLLVWMGVAWVGEAFLGWFPT